MRRYDSSDYATVCEWFRARGMRPPAATSLPTFGFIEPGVAAGWLYRTDSDVALLENYVTAPTASSEARNAALDEITAALVCDAKALGFANVVALTLDDGIAARAERHGLNDMGTYRVLGMEV